MLPKTLHVRLRCVWHDIAALYADYVKYVLPAGSVVYTGCVGDDDLAEQLRLANAKEDVESAYLVKKGEKTGACAVILTGHHRFVLGHRATSTLKAPAPLSRRCVRPRSLKNRIWNRPRSLLSLTLRSSSILAASSSHMASKARCTLLAKLQTRPRSGILRFVLSPKFIFIAGRCD